MAKKKKSTALLAAPQASSPSRYTSPPVTLRVGQNLQPYFVPETLLQSLGDLPRSRLDDRAIDLVDVDANIGHVIVHFLFTSTYQTLTEDDNAATSTFDSRKEFKKALLAFVAAKKYRLTALQELAKTQIVRCVDEISIIQAAHAIGKDTLSSLQEDASWLQDLILQKAERSFEENDGIFSSASFFNGIKNLKMAKLLGQCVAKLYYNKFEEMSVYLSEAQTRLVEITIAMRENVNEPEHVQLESEEPEPEPVASGEDNNDAEGLAPPPIEAENEADKWGSLEPPKKMKKKKKKLADAVCSDPSASTPTPVTNLAPALEAPQEPAAVETPAAFDPTVAAAECAVIEHHAVMEEPSVADGIALVEEVAPIEEPIIEEAAPVEIPDPFAGLNKKERKKLEKRLKAEAALKELQEARNLTVHEAQVTEVVVEPAYLEGDDRGPTFDSGDIPVPESAPPDMSYEKISDPFVGLSKSQKKKLEKKLKAEAEEAEMERQAAQNAATGEARVAEAVVEPEYLEPDIEPPTYEVEDMPVADPASPDMAPEATSETFTIPEPYAEETTEVVPEAITNALQEAASDMPTESAPTTEDSPVIVDHPPINIEEDPWGFWGVSSKKKKKKGKKAKVAEVEDPPPPFPPREEPEPPPREEPEAVAIDDLIEPKLGGEPVPVMDGQFRRSIRVRLSALDDDDCPMRYEHLSHHGLWRECEQCELYMTRVAIKLHSVGMQDVNGLVLASR